MLGQTLVLDHVAVLSDHVDEGQEVLALDAAFVKVFRLAVRGRLREGQVPPGRP